MGCGGLLGVNRGSVEPPRTITLSYRPSGTPSGRLALVGVSLYCVLIAFIEQKPA